MMLFYNLPCRRISPVQYGKRKIGRGSVLVCKDEVLLIIEPGDQHLNFPHTHEQICGPRQTYLRGILPGSRFYTQGQTLVSIETAESVRRLRALKKSLAPSGHPLSATGQISRSSFFDQQALIPTKRWTCQESFYLSAYISGVHARETFTALQEEDERVLVPSAG